MLGEFAPILHALAARGIAGPAVWDMELWEIASALGVGAAPQPPAPNATLVSPSGRDLIAERVAHAQGAGPKPEPDPHGTRAPSLPVLRLREPT